MAHGQIASDQLQRYGVRKRGVTVRALVQYGGHHFARNGVVQRSSNSINNYLIPNVLVKFAEIGHKQDVPFVLLFFRRRHEQLAPLHLGQHDVRGCPLEVPVLDQLHALVPVTVVRLVGLVLHPDALADNPRHGRPAQEQRRLDELCVIAAELPFDGRQIPRVTEYREHVVHV